MRNFLFVEKRFSRFDLFFFILAGSVGEPFSPAFWLCVVVGAIISTVLGGDLRSKSNSKKKTSSSEFNFPFDVNQKVIYTGDDEYLLYEQKFNGYLEVSGYYNPFWINVSCSPMSYKVKYFKPF